MIDFIYKNAMQAYEECSKVIETNSELSLYFDYIDKFGGHILHQCMPSDFESLSKVWYFPLNEAETEIKYSAFLAKMGLFKTAIASLRSSFELVLVYAYYLLNAKGKGHAWEIGKVPTPFKEKMVKFILGSNDFDFLNNKLSIKSKIDTIYGKLCNISHTMGRPHSHIEYTKANFPRFLPESLEKYVAILKDTIDVICILVVGSNPIILFPIPIEDKYGINGPMSGFLEEHEVEVLRGLMKPETFSSLITIFEKDERISTQIAYFNSLPDISEDDFKKQLDEWDENMKKMQHISNTEDKKAAAAENI